MHYPQHVTLSIFCNCSFFLTGNFKTPIHCLHELDPKNPYPTLVPPSRKCPSGYIPRWRSCYKLNKRKLDRDNALAACEVDKASLVSVHHEDEHYNTWALALQVNQSIWIGLHLDEVNPVFTLKKNNKKLKTSNLVTDGSRRTVT